jgi:hypothetical protein
VRCRRPRREGGGRRLAREVAALSDGGDVGPVAVQDGFEDVACLGGVGGFGDDVEAVVVASSGGGHVQAPMRGRVGDQGEGDVDGVALVAVFGGRVAEPHVPGGVPGGEGDGAVSEAVGHGQRPVIVHLTDLPDEITLSRQEAATVLFALDEAIERTDAGDPFRLRLEPQPGSSSSGSCLTFPTSEQGPTLVSVNDELLRVPEVARRLGIDGTAVYGLIDTGELAAGKGKDGLVYVTESALREYERHHAASAR